MRYEGIRQRINGVVIQSEAEAAAERLEDLEGVDLRISSLMDQICGNLAMLSRCTTERALSGLFATIANKAYAVRVLNAQRRGERDSARWHLINLRWQEVSLRMWEVARQGSVQPFSDDQEYMLDRIEYRAVHGFPHHALPAAKQVA